MLNRFASIHPWSVRLLRVGGGLAIAAMVGCDDFPGTNAPQLTATAESVTARGRGGYDWNVRLGRFDVARPTSYEFVEQLDQEKLAAKLKLPGFTEPTQPLKPDWMKDDVYQKYSRYSEPHWKPTTIFEVDFGSANARACMTFDGKRMVVASDKLVEWDLNTGKALHTYDLPLTEGIPLAYDDEQQTVLVYNPEKILCLSLADGQIAHSWRPASGKILNAIRAREADVVAVVTDDNQLFAVSDNLSQVAKYRGDQLDTPRIAVHPQGKWVLGILPSGYARWHLNEDGKPATVTTPVHAMFNAECIPVCGTRYDRLVDPYCFYEHGPGTEERAARKSRTPNFHPSLICLNAVAATTSSSQDWLVVVGDKGDFHGNVRTYIQDFSLQDMEYSLPWEIPFSGDFKILTSDWAVERIAFQVGSSIKVVERRAWVDPTGTNLMHVISRMFRDGRIDEVESLVNMLRAQQVHRFGKTGEEMFSECIQYLGATWSDMETAPIAEEISDKIAQWQKAGSELAKLVSIQRHIHAGASARGNKEGSAVTASGWQELDRRMKLAQREIQLQLSNKQISLSLLNAFVDSARYSGIPLDDSEPYVQQCIELYPQSTAVAVSFCNSLLPRWGGTAGEGGALVGAIADSYPPEAGDIFYARTALGLYAMYGPTVLEPAEAGFSATRILYGADLLLGKGIMTRRETELTMALARSVGKLDTIDQLAKYHYQNFGLIGDEGFRTDIIVKMYQTRALALPAGYDTLD